MMARLGVVVIGSQQHRDQGSASKRALNKLLGEPVWWIGDDRVDQRRIGSCQEIDTLGDVRPYNGMTGRAKNAKHFAGSGGRLPDPQSRRQVRQQRLRNPLRGFVGVPFFARVAALAL